MLALAGCLSLSNDAANLSQPCSCDFPSACRPDSPAAPLLLTLQAYRSLRVMSADVPALFSLMLPPAFDSTLMVLLFLKV